MSIIDNKEEVDAIFLAHQTKVKDSYKASSIDTFVSAYYDALSSDDPDEMYIELGRTETISGHAEIIGWDDE